MDLYTFNKTFRRANPQKIFYMFKWKITSKRPGMQFDSSHPCVFTLSTGRAGTETLSELMKLAKTVNAHHEPWPELFGLSKLAYEYSADYPQDEKLRRTLTEGFLACRREFLYNALYCDRGYFEAGPPATFLAPLISEAIPQAKFIHLVRNPKSMITSAMRRGWYNGHAYDKSRIIPLEGTRWADIWETLNPFQKNCWLWAETNRWILDFSERIGPEKILLLKSEQIFTGETAAIQALFDYVFNPVPPRARIDKVMRTRFNAQTTGDFNMSADWSSALPAPLTGFVGAVATRLGYRLL
jgi:hypothetical protein